eukprot:9497890-Pyramimonas_sp.AAC.1
MSPGLFSLGVVEVRVEVFTLRVFPSLESGMGDSGVVRVQRSFFTRAVTPLRAHDRPLRRLLTFQRSRAESFATINFGPESAFRTGREESGLQTLGNPERSSKIVGTVRQWTNDYQYYNPSQFIGLDIDYKPLEAALKGGNFREADDLTRALLITIAGEEAEIREFVYFTEVKTMPVEDLQTIDNLWTAYSDGKFGYSVQRSIWQSGQIKEKWGKFFKKLDWTVGDNNSYRSWANNEYIYSMDAAKGHLPLTSCLRGTQLLRGLLEHPAFAPAGSNSKSGDSKGDSKGGKSEGGRPSWKETSEVGGSSA